MVAVPRKWPYPSGTACTRCKNPLAHRRKYQMCTPCAREWAREYRRRPEVKAEHIAAFRARVYGVSQQRYAAMVAAGGGKCHACGLPETATRRGAVKTLAVDHEHGTGTIRGLLCSRCNTALGLLGDNPGRIAALLVYLLNYSAVEKVS